MEYIYLVKSTGFLDESDYLWGIFTDCDQAIEYAKQCYIGRVKRVLSEIEEVRREYGRGFYESDEEAFRNFRYDLNNYWVNQWPLNKGDVRHDEIKTIFSSDGMKVVTYQAALELVRAYGYED
jgi:hypothetical protein